MIVQWPGQGDGSCHGREGEHGTQRALPSHQGGACRVHGDQDGECHDGNEEEKHAGARIGCDQAGDQRGDPGGNDLIPGRHLALGTSKLAQEPDGHEDTGQHPEPDVVDPVDPTIGGVEPPQDETESEQPAQRPDREQDGQHPEGDQPTPRFHGWRSVLSSHQAPRVSTTGTNLAPLGRRRKLRPSFFYLTRRSAPRNVARLSSASSRRAMSPHAPSTFNVPDLRSKRGSTRPTSRSPTSSGRT
jgi:hypothetical protein